jgi:hypothetical protein
LHHKNRQPDYEKQYFFGQLEAIYEIELPRHSLLESTAQVLVLAAIRPCDARLNLSSKFYTYEEPLKPIEVVDLQTIECVVGRIHDGDRWTIIDRSGELARATYFATGDDNADD